MKKTIIILYLALVSWDVTAQHDHSAHGRQTSMKQMEPMFKDKAVGTTYNQYILLKNALVASDFQKANLASESLLKAIQNAKLHDKVMSEALLVTQAKTLAIQRNAFSSLSKEMAILVKDTGLTMGELYLEYCPMANGKTGGYWLSNDKEISNPYFGDKMLKCGRVKEVIK